MISVRSGWVVLLWEVVSSQERTSLPFLTGANAIALERHRCFQNANLESIQLMSYGNESLQI